MLNTSFILPQLFPWIILAFTIVSAFIKPKIWPYGLVATLAVGFFYNAIDLMGIGIVTGLYALAFLAQKSSNQLINYSLGTLVIISCLALAAHLLPGFNNLLMLDNVNKSINSDVFTLYLNFDKPMILFALIILFPTLLVNNSPVILFRKFNFGQLSLITLIMLIIIFSCAFSFSLIDYEPIIPTWWWLFALNNLLLTCVVEEVFFRGFIQQKLTDKFNPYIGLIAASLIFGIAHFAGGAHYIIVATIAGFLYGFIYLTTGKIVYAICIHFTLNIIHLFLFTYPLLK